VFFYAKKFSPGEYRQIPTKSGDLPAGGSGAQRKADDSLKDEIQQECRSAGDCQCWANSENTHG